LKVKTTDWQWLEKGLTSITATATTSIHPFHTRLCFSRMVSLLWTH